MQFFKPTTMLDKFYEVGIIVKGIDGTLELLGGVLLLTLSQGTILGITHALTHTELSEDPHSFIATHVLHTGDALAYGHAGFAALFLLTHGAVKVGIVIALLLQKLWAYPWALGALGLFLVYQVYLLAVRPTFGMWLLTILDIVIIWLVWREWQQQRNRPSSGQTKT